MVYKVKHNLTIYDFDLTYSGDKWWMYYKKEIEEGEDLRSHFNVKGRTKTLRFEKETDLYFNKHNTNSSLWYSRYICGSRPDIQLLFRRLGKR